jgi:hypothetical protein
MSSRPEGVRSSGLRTTHLVIGVFMSNAKDEDPQIVVARIAAAAYVEAAKIAADASRRN